MKVQVAQLCPTLCDPMVFTVHGILQARILEWVAFPFSRDFPNPGIQPRSPALQVDSLLAETQGKPKNTGVGSLSLLRGIFPTQESNWGLLHCRRTLYQLSNEEAHIYLKLILSWKWGQNFRKQSFPSYVGLISTDIAIWLLKLVVSNCSLPS